MPWMSPMAQAAEWKRPYTSVQWAWVKALAVEPSEAWRMCAPVLPRERRWRPSAEVRECFENRRRVDMDDRS